MKKTNLFDNLDLYSFNHPEEFNLLVIVDQNKALLIDTGQAEIAKAVQLALESAKITATKIVNSHYHPDHINGNYIFSQCKFWGSEYYQENFELFAALHPDIPYIKPHSLLKDGQIMTHGPFQLKFINLRGHSRDSLVIVIDHQDFSAPIVHVADLLMFTNTGQHSIPYLSYDGSISEHIDSLETLSKMEIGLLIPSHGSLLKTQPEIEEAIQLRLFYLHRLEELGKKAQVEDCLIGSRERYNLLHLHRQNIKNIFG